MNSELFHFISSSSPWELDHILTMSGYPEPAQSLAHNKQFEGIPHTRSDLRVSIFHIIALLKNLQSLDILDSIAWFSCGPADSELGSDAQESIT